MSSQKYPTFSVLMSVYNKDNPEQLDTALKSIESQSVVPNEIVLVEDGPLSSHLQHVITRHKKHFQNTFKIVKSDSNQGLGAALRFGTSFVSNDWIARMDADDISAPDRFQKQLSEVVAHPDLALVGGQIYEFARVPENIVGKRKVPTTLAKINKFIKWRNPFNHPTVMINKKKLLAVGGYVSFGNLEDYYLWARFIANGFSACNLDDVLVYMRVDHGMYSRRGQISNIKYFIELRKYLSEEGFINKVSEIIGDLIMVINLIIPASIRKSVYQNIFHNAN